MALSIIPATHTHLLCLASRDYSGGVDLRDPKARSILLTGDCFTATDKGEVYGVAGIIPLWPGVGHGWAVIARPTGTRRLLFFTRQVRLYLQTSDKWRRIQTTVCADFGEGLAWATHLLGFTPEGLHLKYDEQGRDHIPMARVT